MFKAVVLLGFIFGLGYLIHVVVGRKAGQRDRIADSAVWVRSTLATAIKSFIYGFMALAGYFLAHHLLSPYFL